MKKLYWLVMSILPFVLASCGDETEGKIDINDAAPAKVSNVTASSGPGEVYLAWQNPSDPSFMYVKIEYINSKGEKKYQLLSKERVGDDNIARDTIRGFGSTEEKVFSFFACTLRGTHQGAVDIKQAPETPAFVEVIKTIDVEPDLGGVVVSWENNYLSPVYVVLDYYLKSDPTQQGVVKITAQGKTADSQFVQLTTADGILEGELCVINVTAQDQEENASEIRKFELTPKRAYKFSKENWSFPGYNDSSNDATIGYSSQEALGEGASPNGRVIALTDNNLNTFWHTAWKTSSAFPHFFILDLGEDKVISTVALFRRQSDHGTTAQKGHIIYTCSSTDAGGSDPDSWNWENHGSFSFDVNNKEAQNYRLSSNPVARYIKVYFGTEHQGTGNFAMLAEMDVYGVDVD